MDEFPDNLSAEEAAMQERAEGALEDDVEDALGQLAFVIIESKEPEADLDLLRVHLEEVWGNLLTIFWELGVAKSHLLADDADNLDKAVLSKK